MDLANPCTGRCELVVAAHPERGEPLRFALAADGSPRAAVLWADDEIRIGRFVVRLAELP